MNGNIVLIGAGGTGMSAIAGILFDLGYGDNIICIDGNQSELTDKLQKKGLKVLIGNNVYKPELFDHVIYSEACVNSPEVNIAKSYERTPKQMRFIGNYFQFIGEICKYFYTIGIAGTNGKSSTTSMLIDTAKAHLDNLGLGIVGALVPSLDGNNYFINQNKKDEIKNIFDYIFTGKGLNYNFIKKNYFIIESCEYKRHFLMLDTDLGTITNIELDHTDYYKDIQDYRSAFIEWSSKVKQGVITTEGIGINNIEQVNIKKFNFKKIFGEHNNKNGTLVFELIKRLKPSINIEQLIQTIENFGGLRRRMEYLKTTDNGAIIFSDYGHMASSISLCYDALRQHFPDKKLTAIFQPHQINRVLRERKEFGETLNKFDHTYIYNIYAARENLEEQLTNFKNLNIKNINSIEELGNIFAQNCNGTYITNIDQIKKIIENSNDNEIITIFSAGDIDYKIRNI